MPIPRRRNVGDPGEAQIRVLFPEPVGRHFGEVPNPGLAGAQGFRRRREFRILLRLAAELPADDGKQHGEPESSAEASQCDDRRLAPPLLKRHLLHH